ncbi:MAG TPA: mandelate racemase/muconate lactonizing enzyme family protein [Planctomycetaceae bacterium]|nr:mandelate racemase/muconate lactonizing enzyme family protein [Planctomycetaceae bacterium]
MRITRIETFPVRIPLKPKYHMLTALGRHEVSEYLLVRIDTDAGIEGAGEATVSVRWSGETVPGAKALIEQVFAPCLLGRDPREIEEIDRTLDASARFNWFAKAALEMACQDIRGKDAGQPVYELLGGAARPLAIGCRFSMGAFPPERARQRAAELVAEGFTTIKVKVGTGDLNEDVERVRAVRAAIGPDRELTIDANCGYDAATAIEAARRMEPFRVALFEQPTPQRDFGALAEVRRNVSCEVMADDIVFDLDDARECLRNEACDCVSVYPGKNGGIHKSRAIVELAAAGGVGCTIGSNLELDVASAAMAHLVVACPNMQVERYPGDLLGPAYHEFSIAKNPLSISGPVTTITDRPGLGVEVDWGLVSAHPC